MAQVYLGLGSNLGDRQANLMDAVGRLNVAGIKVSGISKIIETPPYGFTGQPDFLNCVCLAQTGLAPEDLLTELKAIEKAMGRQKVRCWGPRNIDLDILLYDDKIIRADKLVIPHKDMLNRLFVLQPLCELAPDLLHPVSKKSMCSHLAELAANSQEEGGQG